MLFRSREMSLRTGIFGAEPWTEQMRRQIEGDAGIDAVDIYGLSEVMGPGVASECVESKDGPVIWEDHFLAEIIDPDTGEVLPYDPASGTPEGELVFTSLTKEAFPIVRYRTRDLTRLLPPTSRGMRRIGKIVGRSDDMLIIRGVNLFPTQVEELVLQTEGLSGQYQLVVTRDGTLDEVAVHCEVLPSHASTDRDAVARHLQHRIKTLIGVSTRVHVGAPESIERTLVGKARRFAFVLKIAGNRLRAAATGFDFGNHRLGLRHRTVVVHGDGITGLSEAERDGATDALGGATRKAPTTFSPRADSAHRLAITPSECATITTGLMLSSIADIIQASQSQRHGRRQSFCATRRAVESFVCQRVCQCSGPESFKPGINKISASATRIIHHFINAPARASAIKRRVLSIP